MRWKLRLNTENIFLISGLLIIVLGWISDFVGLLVLNEPKVGGHSAGSIINRLFFTLFGLFFAAGGAVYENHTRFLSDPVYSKRYLIQALFILDGALHLFAFNDHIGVSVVEAGFFAVVGPVHARREDLHGVAACRRRWLELDAVPFLHPLQHEFSE